MPPHQLILLISSVWNMGIDARIEIPRADVPSVEHSIPGQAHQSCRYADDTRLSRAVLVLRFAQLDCLPLCAELPHAGDIGVSPEPSQRNSSCYRKFLQMAED
jgi:hypothetical protein